MRKFTPVERAGVAEAFKAAKTALWSGSGGNGAWGTLHAGGKCIEKYICTCIDKTNRWNANPATFQYGAWAKMIVQDRLGEHYSLESWLKSKGVSKSKQTGYLNPKKMQAYRLAWLDLLIEEFSE